MTWFKVDDSFHSHHKALQAGNGALGLWVRCGSYCAQHLTDGFIPREIVLMYGSRAIAAKLVAAKLWEAVEGGWIMHDYGDYNPSAERVRADRHAATERQRNAREAAKSQRLSRRDIPRDSQRSSNVSHGPPDPTRTQPNPKPPVEIFGGDRPETNARARATEPPQPSPSSENKPSERCTNHRDLDGDPGPCRGCMKAREHAQQWAKDTAQQRITTVRACTWCDPDGWRIDPRHQHRGPLSPAVRCDHTAWSSEQLETCAS